MNTYKEVTRRPHFIIYLHLHRDDHDNSLGVKFYA